MSSQKLGTPGIKDFTDLSLHALFPLFCISLTHIRGSLLYQRVVQSHLARSSFSLIPCATMAIPPHRRRKAKRRLTKTPTAPRTATGKGFFDFPPEVRNLIYHYLLNGQTVDMAVDNRRGETGLNILLTCKTCLTEVKLLALTQATFRIRRFSPNVCGLRKPQLSLINSLTLTENAGLQPRVLARSRMLKIMPHLCKVTIYRDVGSSCGIVLPHCDYCHARQAFGLLESCNLSLILQHVQKAALQDRKEPEFVVQFRYCNTAATDLGYWRTSVCHTRLGCPLPPPLPFPPIYPLLLTHEERFYAWT